MQARKCLKSNRDTLWFSQGKKDHLKAAIVGGMHHVVKIIQ